MKRHLAAICAWVLVPVFAVLLCGCETYEAHPLDPAKVEAEFRARSLDDPGLREFMSTCRGDNALAGSGDSWDLDSLTFVAFYFHPDLDVARAGIGEADAGIETAGASPNPSIGWSAEYQISKVASKVTPWTLGFTFDLPIETAGKRGCRIDRARADAEASRLRLAESAWRIRSALRSAFVQYMLATEEEALLQSEVRARSDVLSRLERRLSVGEASRRDVDVQRVAADVAALSHARAKGAIQVSRVALASALGVPEAALEGRKLAWPGLDRPPSDESAVLRGVVATGLTNRLDIVRALAEYAATEAALRLEIAKQFPDVHVGPGYAWDQGASKFSLGIGVELPILNDNGGPIAEAEARRRESAARFLATQARAIGQIESAVASWRAATAALAVATRAEEGHLVIEKRTESAVAAGQEDAVALAESRALSASASRARLGALREVQAAQGALEDATQRPLEGGLDLRRIPLEKGSLPGGERE